MRDRIPQKVLDNGAVRYAAYDESGKFLRYEYMLPADEPADEGTPLSKETLLSDDTEAAIWGDLADRTVDDVLNKTSVIFRHWWKRRLFDEHTDVVLGSTANYVIQRASTNTAQKSVKYSDSYVLNEDGTISLGGTIAYAYLSYNEYSDANMLKGKYFVVDSYSADGDTGSFSKVTFGNVYFAPSNASVGATNSPSRMVYITAQPVIAEFVSNIGEWEYISSHTVGAYPESGFVDGYQYEYLGVPIDNARLGTRIKELKYVGTGSKGSSSSPAVSLVLEDAPKVVFIQSATGHAMCNPILVTPDTEGVFSVITQNSSSSDYGRNKYIYKTASKTLTWYNSAGTTDKESTVALNTTDSEYIVRYLY